MSEQLGVSQLIPAYHIREFGVLFPEARIVLRDLIENNLIPLCGIVYWSIMRAYLEYIGHSAQELPMRYEEYWGDPGDQGMTTEQALDFLRRRDIR
jgi:hypothetical protein